MRSFWSSMILSRLMFFEIDRNIFPILYASFISKFVRTECSASVGKRKPSKQNIRSFFRLNAIYLLVNQDDTQQRTPIPSLLDLFEKVCIGNSKQDVGKRFTNKYFFCTSFKLSIFVIFYHRCNIFLRLHYFFLN